MVSTEIAAPGAGNKLPAAIPVSLVLLCLTPLALQLIGVSLATPITSLNLTTLPYLPRTDQIRILHQLLSGDFIHSLLEWSGFTIAMLTGILSLFFFQINRSPLIPLMATVLISAGCMNALRTLVADDLLERVVDVTNFLPFTSALFSLFSPLLLCIGGFVLLRRGSHRATGQAMWGTLGAVILVAFMAYGIIHFCAIQPTLPETIFTDQWVKRPLDLLALPLMALLAVVTLPRLYQQTPSCFAYALMWSLLPLTSAQIYLAFGSTELYDHHFNAADALRIIAFFVPFLGLAFDVVENARSREAAVKTSNNLVNELLQLQETLEQQKSQTSAILDNAAEGVITINDHGIIQSFNNAAERIFGYSADEMIGQNITQLQPPEVRSHDDTYIRRYLQLGKARVTGIGRELEGVHKNGQRLNLYLSISEIKTAESRLFTGILHDITDRKRAEEERNESLRRFTQLSQTINDVFWMTNADGSQVIYVSPAYERIWGHTCEALYQNPFDWQTAIHPDDLPGVLTLFTPEKLAAGDLDVEYRVIRPDGDTRWVHTVGYPVRDEEGQVYRISGIASDITAFKEVEKMKSMFIASMSHELRTPLNSIIGFTSITYEEWTGPLNDEQKTNLKTVLRSGKHLLTLINDVIDVSKIEAGKLETTVEPVSVADIVLEAVEHLRPDADEKGLNIKTNISPVTLNTDRNRLLQCLLNLVSNAVKYTESGTVTVTLDEEPPSKLNKFKSSARVTVKDSGIGIEPGSLKHLFTPFTRLDSPLKSSVSGTGLGLYLTAKLTREILHGDIRCVSEPGKGSSFTLWIPDMVERGSDEAGSSY